MLDLTLQKDLYEIKWVDGEVLKLKAPTQKQFMDIQKIIKIEDYSEVVSMVYDLVTDILNNNTKKRKINAEELSLDTCVIVLQDYFEFFSQLMQKNVVFQHSQQ